MNKTALLLPLVLALTLSACTSSPAAPAAAPVPGAQTTVTISDMGLAVQNDYVDLTAAQLSSATRPTSIDAHDALRRVSGGLVRAQWIEVYQVDGAGAQAACQAHAPCAASLARAKDLPMGRASAALGAPGRWTVVVTELVQTATLQPR